MNCPAYYVICLFTVLGISCLSLLDHRIFSHREDGDCASFKTLSQHIEQFLAPTQCSINIYGMNEVNPLRKFAWPSLAVQWIRILLLMLGTWVLSMVWEDPMCHRVTKACAPQLLSLHSRGREPQLLRPMPQPAKPVGSEPVLCNERSHHNEKPTHRN